jgi:hypothetical protein
VSTRFGAHQEELLRAAPKAPPDQIIAAVATKPSLLQEIAKALPVLVANEPSDLISTAPISRQQRGSVDRVLKLLLQSTLVEFALLKA